MSYDVKDAKAAYEADKSGWEEVFKPAKEDIEFLSPGGQWDDGARKSRLNANLPALEVDQLNQYVHQVVNDIRMNTPSINVLPVDDGSDIETAKTYKGIIRHIEYASNADAAYDTAMEYAVKCGIGFVRVEHDFSALTGGEQELLIKRVVNPFSVFLDSSIVECDGRDAMRGTILDSYTKMQYEAEFGDYKFISFDGDGKTEGKEGESINVAEVFKVEEKESAALMRDGTEQPFKKGMRAGSDNVLRVLKSRKVIRCKMNGEEVMQETTFPGLYVPIVPFFGEEVWVDGKRQVYSLIRRSKDAQRRYNMWSSTEMDILIKAPESPIMAPLGQLTGLAGWNDPKSVSVLEYRTIDAATGKELPPPQRLAPPQIPTGIINAMQGAKEDIKATLGMYDASIGNRSNEVSGVAIEQRQRKGDVATFHFGDNGVRSITQIGRILVSAAPIVYDTARVVRIIGDEDEPKMVGINGKLVEGQKQTFDLTQGQYDVRVTTGPSFTTKRQESAALMQEVMKNPQLMAVAGDLAFKYSDVAGADALAARLKKTIPPQFLEPEDGQQEMPPEVIQAQQQAQQAVQQAQQVLQETQGQMQEMATELDRLKSENANKTADTQLKAQDQAHKQEMDAANLTVKMQEMSDKKELDHMALMIKQEELAIKKVELEIKKEELALEAYKAQNEATLAVQTAANQAGSSASDTAL